MHRTGGKNLLRTQKDLVLKDQNHFLEHHVEKFLNLISRSLTVEIPGKVLHHRVKYILDLVLDYPHNFMTNGLLQQVTSHQNRRFKFALRLVGVPQPIATIPLKLHQHLKVTVGIPLFRLCPENDAILVYPLGFTPGHNAKINCLTAS